MPKYTFGFGESKKSGGSIVCVNCGGKGALRQCADGKYRHIIARGCDQNRRKQQEGKGKSSTNRTKLPKVTPS